MSENSEPSAAGDRWKSIDAIRASVPGGQNPLLRQGISPRDWAGRNVPPRRWVVDGLIPVGGVTLMYGDGALGKSLLAMQLQAACAVGASWLGQITMQCATIGFFTEDDADEIHRRGADIYRHYGASLDDERLDQVRYFDRVGLENSLVDFGKYFDRDTGITKNLWETTQFYGDIVEVAQRRSARLVILDALADVYAGLENEKSMVRYFMAQLRNIATEIDGAVLLLAHPSVNGMASGTGTSGNTAWNNSARSRLYLTRSEVEGADPDMRALSTKKANYGRTGKQIKLRWTDGVFITEEQDGMVASLTRDNHAAAVLEGLRELAAKKVTTSPAPNAPNYAPKLLQHQAACKGLGLATLKKVTTQLIATGQISKQPIGLDGSRHEIFGLVGVAKPLV